MKTVLITGGTGMIGMALTQALLGKNYNVIILSRGGSPPYRRAGQQSASAKTSADEQVTSNEQLGRLSYAQWNIEQQTIDRDAISRSDYIIHLAGAGVADKRWTKKRKQEIVDSRVKGGELLVTTLRENSNRVKALLTSSGIGWYGPDPVMSNPRPFIETDPPASDFLGLTCQQWEGSIDPATQLGIRLVKFRTGIVLKQGEGALKEFERPLRFGTAAILGSGKQVISWIHIDDLVRMYINAIENDNINGVYNAVAPSPVCNKDFTMQLARIRNGKLFIPFYVPSFLLKWVLGEMSIEVLKSATVSSSKAQQEGFNFLFPSIGNAFNNLYNQNRS